MRYHLPLLVFFKSHTHTYIYYSGAHETEFTGHSVWSHDANVILERESHLKLMTMGLVQTCSYVIKQMQTKVTIDINKFLEAFSMEADGHCIHSPLWTQSEHNSASIRPHTPMVQSNLHAIWIWMIITPVIKQRQFVGSTFKKRDLAFSPLLLRSIST